MDKKICFRIAHPDCPGLPQKCVDMCNNEDQTHEQGWSYIGDVDIPEEIRSSPECWDHGFFPIEKNECLSNINL
jgi:hypothetical protein